MLGKCLIGIWLATVCLSQSAAPFKIMVGKDSFVVEEPLTLEDELRVAFSGKDVKAVMAKSGDGKSLCMLQHRCCSTGSFEENNELDATCENGLKNCIIWSRIKQVDVRVEKCRKRFRKVCPEPCPECPTFCQPNKVIKCQDQVNVVKKVEKPSMNCQPLTSTNGGGDAHLCKFQVRRHDVIRQTRFCNETVADEPLCAPINCHFEASGRDCEETSRSINVTLNDEACDFCHSNNMEVCVDSNDSTCYDNPQLLGKWAKMCQASRTVGFEKRAGRQEGNAADILESLKKAFNTSADPVRQLLLLNAQEEPAPEKPRVEEEEAWKDRSSTLEKQSDVFIVAGIPVEDSIPSGFVIGEALRRGENTGDPVYFDPAINMRALNERELVISAMIPVNQSTIERASDIPTASPTTSTTTTSSTTTTTTASTTATTTTTDTTTTAVTTMTTNPATTTTTSTTTSTSTTTTTTLTMSTTTATAKEEETTVAFADHVTPPKNPTTEDGRRQPKKIQEEAPKRNEIEITSKILARLCLFENICDEKRAKQHLTRGQVASSATPSTSKPAATTIAATTAIEATPRRSFGNRPNRLVLARVQRCIQNPRFCDTDFFSSSAKQTTVTTTTTTTTANPLQAAIDCVNNGDCELADIIPERSRSSPRSTSDMDLRVRLCLFGGVC